LEGLGVDFNAQENKAYKFFAGGAFMPLCVETWRENGTLVCSVAHYYEQNGDAMADPDVCFEVYERNYCDAGKEKPNKYVVPLYYQQDGLGVFQRARYKEGEKTFYSSVLTRSIKSFLSTWAKNIKVQGYGKKKESEN